MQVTGRIKARRTAYDVQFKLVCNAKFHPQNQQMGNYFKPSGKFKLSCEDNLPSPSVIVLPTSYQCAVYLCTVTVQPLYCTQKWSNIIRREEKSNRYLDTGTTKKGRKVN